MLNFFILLTSLLSGGDWMCTHGDEYPEHDLSENFYSHISYFNDLSFSAKTEIIYKRLNGDRAIGKVFSESNGITEITGETFAHIPKTVSVGLVFDDFDGLDEEYLEYLKSYLSEPVRGLKIKKIDSNTMEILHAETQTTTHCSKTTQAPKLEES